MVKVHIPLPMGHQTLIYTASESATEAEEYRGRLDNQLAQVVSNLPHQSQSTLTPTPTSTLGDNTIITVKASTASIIDVDLDSSSMMTVNSARLKFYRLAFESTLFFSWLYWGMSYGLAISLASSQVKGTRWSLVTGSSDTSVFSLAYSGINLTEVPEIARIKIPVGMRDLYNSRWYGTDSRRSFAASAAFRKRVLTLASIVTGDPKLALIPAVKLGDTTTLLRILEQGASVESTNN